MGVTCTGCDKQWREEDTAPYMQYSDGTVAVACRKCISTWIVEGMLWPIPFWKLREIYNANLG